MASDPYTDLQGCSKIEPRGFLHKSFDDCIMFHLLTVFPNYADEQEHYFIMNVLKMPQRLSMHQFVQRVEQLNSYIVQLPGLFFSPSAKPNTIPMNVPFAKADLASHVLWKCPHMWQDQFNLHKKGINLCFSCLLRLLTNAQSTFLASSKGKKGNKRPGTESTARVPKKACPKKHCNLCKKHGGTYTTHNTKDCCR